MERKAELTLGPHYNTEIYQEFVESFRETYEDTAVILLITHNLDITKTIDTAAALPNRMETLRYKRQEHLIRITDQCYQDMNTSTHTHTRVSEHCYQIKGKHSHTLFTTYHKVMILHILHLCITRYKEKSSAIVYQY